MPPRSAATVPCLAGLHPPLTSPPPRPVAPPPTTHQWLIGASPPLPPRVFGWTPRAELSNGRWVMFGLLVGLLTEYATAVNFIDQVRLTLSNLGIADVYD